MLEQLRQSSRSFIIWILFGIIIAVFIVSFGPQANPDSFGCGASNEYVVKIEDEAVSAHSWRFAMNGLGFGSGGGSDPQALTRRQIAIDYLVERELLAQAAESSGFRVNDDVVNASITQGMFFVMGRRLNGRNAFFRNGVFDYDYLERFASSLGLPSVPYFINEQRREILADMMRDLIMQSSKVSREEARTSFIHDNTKITAEYVKFDIAAYSRAMNVDEAALTRYAADNADALKKAWENEKAQYAADKPRILARHIYVSKPATTDGDASSDEAKKKIEAARARVVGGEDFGKVAQEVSEDDRTKFRGGSMGWRPAESLGYGKELVEASKDLEIGKISDVIETNTGFHVLRVDERSDKGLTFEQRKLDIAARLAPKAYARARAKMDAEAALAETAEKPLDELFEKASTTPAVNLPPGLELPPGVTIDDVMNAPPADDAVVPEELEDAVKKKQPPTKPPAKEPSEGSEGDGDEPEPGSESGWIFRTVDIPVQIGSDDAKADEPATPPEPEPEPVISGDVPEPVGLEKPKLQTVGPVAREGEFLAGIGRSEEVVKALFEELETGAVAKKVYEVSEPDGFVIIRLVDRQNADLDKFNDEAKDEIRELEMDKGIEILVSWIQDRCKATASSGKVLVNRAYLAPDGAKEAPAYQTCQFINFRSALEQILTRQSRTFDQP